MTYLEIQQVKPAAQASAWAFFMLVALTPSVFAQAISGQKAGAIEEMSSEEKKDLVQEFLREGDRLAALKDYNLANASYEGVFLVEPEHIEASKRIDKLKKQMIKEGLTETELVTHVYDDEIGIRTQHYMNQAEAFVKNGKLGQARFMLQKLLLISPFHKEANKLYEDVNSQLQKKAA